MPCLFRVLTHLVTMVTLTRAADRGRRGGQVRGVITTPSDPTILTPTPWSVWSNTSLALYSYPLMCGGYKGNAE